jgi:hypothetical protein
MHIYKEVSEGKSLCSYLKQAKLSFFSLTQEGPGKGLIPVRGGRLWGNDIGG